jgi:hypothetical protein
MEIKFTVTIQIVPNKWHDPAVACEPPGCGAISNYENSKYPAWTQSLCKQHNIWIAQDKVTELIGILIMGLQSSSAGISDERLQGFCY